nr:hypothetical protein [Nocardiopsis sinuspersici]
MEALVGLASVAGGLYSLVTAVSGRALDPTSAIPLAALGLGVGALLVFVARGLWRSESWARTPVFLTQVFLAVVAYYMFTSQQYVYCAVLLGVAVCAAAAVLSPPTTAALFPEEREK